MKWSLVSLCAAAFFFMSCDNVSNKSTERLAATSTNKARLAFCSKTCKAQNRSSDISCKLPPAVLQERKETVLRELRDQVLAKEELENGFAFKFPGSDDMLDQLSEFIKAERACCDFFVFGLSISGDSSEIWLELSGPAGAKEFIATELEI